jgi:hypothetical protein
VNGPPDAIRLEAPPPPRWRPPVWLGVVLAVVQLGLLWGVG